VQLKSTDVSGKELMAPVLEVQGITKRFPGVVANDKVNFALEKGQVHALLGENGAGKSTLMNVIYSLYQPDEGRILVKGQDVKFHGPNDAIRLGIGMVHQHFMLVPVMTVTENIMLGQEEIKGIPFISLAAGALIGIALGLAFDGPLGGAFWLVAAALMAVPLFVKLNLKIDRLLLNAILGFVLGSIYELVRGATGSADLGVLIWPPIGLVVGAVIGIVWIDTRKVADTIRNLSAEYGLEVDPYAYITDLPVGAQQRVEIVKALYRHADILILDEPTAVLTPQEADELFKIMRRLTDRGVSIIFITHKLREVLEVADTITVLRRGKVVGTVDPTEATKESLARMMVGREVILQVEKKPATPREVILQIEALAVEDDRHHLAVKDISLEVRVGEILGVAGVQGNGQTELVDAITGLRVYKSGHITLLGNIDTGILNPRAVTSLGTGHVPEDRHRYGLVLNYPVADNLILADYYRSPFSRQGILQEITIQDNALNLVKEFDVRTPSIFTAAGKLSGGNQQKVIVARELARQPKLFIASQPTRGLDVGSIEFIHSQIVEARDRGAGVLLVSAELDEILSLSDRIVVMYRGQIMANIPAEKATREDLGLLMAGVHIEMA
jgi:simple sugar transport system ATP-binding protein